MNEWTNEWMNEWMNKWMNEYLHPFHQLIRGLSARWCPMSPHFLTKWVSRLMGWLWCPGLLPLLVSIAFPVAFHISVFFHSHFFTYHWRNFHSRFLLYGQRICTQSVDPSLTHFLAKFPALGLSLVPDVVIPEVEQGAHEAKFSFQISALAV